MLSPLLNLGHGTTSLPPHCTESMVPQDPVARRAPWKRDDAG
jgi:hypothetical protein